MSGPRGLGRLDAVTATRGLHLTRLTSLLTLPSGKLSTRLRYGQTGDEEYQAPGQALCG